MARYKRPVDTQAAYCKNAKRYRAPAPMPPFRYKVAGGVKVTATYDALHRAWRAGVIEDFYYGTRSADDESLIWKIGADEFAGADLAAVNQVLADQIRAAGVDSLAWGATWCGYRALVVTFAGGLVVEQCYRDGAVREIVRAGRDLSAVA